MSEQQPFINIEKVMDRRYKKRIERYWNKMEKQANDVLSKLEFGEWFDLWHTHLDWDGKGNSRPENRLRASQLTYELLQKVETLSISSVKPIQCFALVCENTMDNAIYIHTENPNNSEFPFTFDDVDWAIKSDKIDSIINNETHECGFYTKGETSTYFIRNKSQ